MTDRRGRWKVAAAGVGTAAVLAVCAAVAWGAWGRGASASPAAPQPVTCQQGWARLTVQGSGTATGTPNLLTLSLSIDVTGPTAQAALADDNSRTGAVITALVAGGVPQREIQTTNLSIEPNYAQVNGSTELTGYGVSDSIVAQLRNFATAGTVIDDAANAGGNATQISSLSFSIADPRPLQDQARQDAVRQAVSHAGAMAAAAGERLGPVCSLTDDTSSPPPVGAVGYAASNAALEPAVPLEAGTQQAEAQVTLVYALLPAPPASPR